MKSTRFSKTSTGFIEKKLRYSVTLAEIYPSIPGDFWGNRYNYPGINSTVVANSGYPRTDVQMKKLNGNYNLFSAGTNGPSISIIAAEVTKEDVIRDHNGNLVSLANEYK